MKKSIDINQLIFSSKKSSDLNRTDLNRPTLLNETELSVSVQFS